MSKTISVFRFEREQSNGWDERYLRVWHFVFAWATLVKGEPWEGEWIGFRAVDCKNVQAEPKATERYAW